VRGRQAKAEALDKKHSISDKANKARADASAKADAYGEGHGLLLGPQPICAAARDIRLWRRFDKKHGLTEKGEAATKAINTHVGAADKKYGVRTPLRCPHVGPGRAHPARHPNCPRPRRRQRSCEPRVVAR
jgi:hypothetical protein